MSPEIATEIGPVDIDPVPLYRPNDPLRRLARKPTAEEAMDALTTAAARRERARVVKYAADIEAQLAEREYDRALGLCRRAAEPESDGGAA